MMRQLIHIVAVGVLAVVLAACAGTAGQEGADAGLTITVVSARPDMVTGGNALLRVDGATTAVHIEIDGRDVTARFRPGEDGAVVGHVEDLPIGRSVVSARSGSARSEITLTNHPISGPVFSGPHITPFICQTEAWDLGPALDDDCSSPTRVQWFYRSTAPAGRGASAFRPLPEGERPADLAIVTVNGLSAPYIVRVETGTINRAVYEIAVLADPAAPPPSPWAPPAAWNGRLVYTFGGGCMAGYLQGRGSGGVMSDLHLSRGYAVASSSLNVNNNNCNDVLSAETMMMVKEHVIESFGPPRHTIGWGGSGGAMQQYEIAQNYPGLLDGIVPTATFPDASTYFIESEDCRLLLRPYLNRTNLTEEQKRAVGGFSTWSTCDRSFAGRPGRLTPTDCHQDIPVEMRYDPVANPKGVRCSIYDGMVNIFGRHPRTGFARSPHDNVGVQYGLAALNARVITTGDFLDLNEGIGGFDVDTNWQAERMAGDPEAIRIAYASGRTVTGGGGLAEVPIIDARNYVDLDGDFHESYHTFRARARLVRANGHADNQVILRAKGDAYAPLPAEYLAQMDRWLDAIAADASSGSRAEKVVRNKPADLVDACWTADGRKIAEPAVYGADSECNRLYPPHSSPRLTAGAPLADDVWKCQLKPIDWNDYSVAFTDAEKARLARIFPAGVCDWSKTSQHHAELAGVWQRY